MIINEDKTCAIKKLNLHNFPQVYFYTSYDTIKCYAKSWFVKIVKEKKTKEKISYNSTGIG